MVVASFVGIGIVAAGTLAFTWGAAAVSPDECILYARAFAIANTAKAVPGTTATRSRQEIQDEAYATCLGAATSPTEPDFQFPSVGDTLPADPLVGKARIPEVSAYTEAPARASSRRAVRAISSAINQVPVGRPEPMSAIEPASCPPTAGTTRFWRGLMFPATGQNC
jgi:hypothetical protein